MTSRTEYLFFPLLEMFLMFRHFRINQCNIFSNLCYICLCGNLFFGSLFSYFLAFWDIISHPCDTVRVGKKCERSIWKSLGQSHLSTYHVSRDFCCKVQRPSVGVAQSGSVTAWGPLHSVWMPRFKSWLLFLTLTSCRQQKVGLGGWLGLLALTWHSPGYCGLVGGVKQWMWHVSLYLSFKKK